MSHIFKQTHNQSRWRIFLPTNRHPDTSGLRRDARRFQHMQSVWPQWTQQRWKTWHDNWQTKDVWCLANVQIQGADPTKRLSEMIRLHFFSHGCYLYKWWSLQGREYHFYYLTCVMRCSHLLHLLNTAKNLHLNCCNSSGWMCASVCKADTWQVQSETPVLPVNEFVLRMLQLHNITWMQLNLIAIF